MGWGRLSPRPGAAASAGSEAAPWKAARRGPRPEPRDFLPDDPDERPSALLALVRAEIGLRWDGGDRATVERYRERYPELGPDDLVALAYEEFCLREEAGGSAAAPAEYDERFPGLAARLRRVFDIHELVGSGGSAAFRASASPEVPFPESGQTMAGFHLREELGRGSFARVFLAEERQLADRPVALKVSRSGSREPQTLARLQHTHIVPVHSTRVDPATGLHLLCMPYFGRVTLERLLAEPGAKTAATGADVLAALDRLEPPSGPPATTARSAFARLPYARALAWWGARMAEALAHAHERGVLHRDINAVERACDCRRAADASRRPSTWPGKRPPGRRRRAVAGRDAQPTWRPSTSTPSPTATTRSTSTGPTDSPWASCASRP